MNLRAAVRRLLVGPPAKTSVELGLVVLGRHSYTTPAVHRYGGDGGVVRVGAFTSIAKEVVFLPGGSHRTDLVSTFPIRDVLLGGEPGIDNAPDRDVIVGSDVYIGRGARIVGPVTIGHGAVVGAYSVVVKDVAPFSVVAGAPAEVKRRRFSVDLCEGLLRIAWWDWPDDLIRDRAEDLMSPDVVAFITKYG